MPIGKISKVSDKLRIACIESNDYIVYVDLDAMPDGYGKNRRIEYDLSINADGMKIASNFKLLPSVFAEWHRVRRS